MDYSIIHLNNLNYPKQLLNIKNPPEKLYVIGNKTLLQSSNIIAIVGSRDCTEYGRQQSFIFSKELSCKNYTIISGLAIGIDSAAHLGALKGKGNTIAVIGSGFNNIYPEENLWLFNYILQNNGCIISEYPPDTKISMKNFPKRNRIISGIANSVTVIEASFRSGSIITAHQAINLNKKVFCLPSNINSKNSSGTNTLIRNGAKLVFKPSHIIEEIDSNNLKQSKTIPKAYEEIYQLLLPGPLSINTLSKKVNKDLSSLQSTLTMMELEEYLEQLPGNKFKIKE